MTPAEIIGLVATGFFSGIFGTIIGIGGGAIFVPVFLLFFGFSAANAAGTSLFAVFFNALAGSLAYFRQKRIDLSAGIKFGLATLPGAVLGTFLTRFIDTSLFGIIFAIFLLCMAVFLPLRRVTVDLKKTPDKPTRVLTDYKGLEFSYSPKIGWGIAISFLVGVISSLLGIGGGIIHVPVMIYLLGFPIYIATATSQFILVGTSFFGGVSHLIIGNVYIVPALIVAATAIPGAVLGAAISRRLKSKFIVGLLTIALALLGVRLLLKSLGIF